MTRVCNVVDPQTSNASNHFETLQPLFSYQKPIRSTEPRRFVDGNHDFATTAVALTLEIALSIRFCLAKFLR